MIPIALTLLGLLAGGLTGQDRSNSPLIAATIKGLEPEVEALLSAGGGVHAVDRRGIDALMHASMGLHFRIVERLIAAGANVRRAAPDGRTPLMFVFCCKNSAEMTEARSQTALLLLRHGVDINAADRQGRTALMYAAGNADIALLQILLCANADDAARDRNGLRTEDHAREAWRHAGLAASAAAVEFLRSTGRQSLCGREQ